MIEWTKDFVQSEKKDMGKSTALLPATRIQVGDEESQVSQIGSVLEVPRVVGMEEEESEISLVLIQLLKMQRCLNLLQIKRVSLYGSRLLILIRRIENNLFVDC